VQALRDNGIELAVVMGTPPELALRLADSAPERVVPIYGAYQVTGQWDMWYRDPSLLERARKALESGRYRGIGELHMIGGFVSDWRTPVIKGLMELAAEFDVPALVHVEFSRAKYLMGLCGAHPRTNILLAHAGAPMPVSEVDKALRACPNLWVELSARDPWRYVAHPIADESGALLPEWRELVVAHADRILVGSDPVWPVEQLDAWDADDTGWHELSRFIGFHRRWMSDLPAEMSEKIRWGNAQRLFLGNGRE